MASRTMQCPQAQSRNNKLRTRILSRFPPRRRSRSADASVLNAAALSAAADLGSPYSERAKANRSGRPSTRKPKPTTA
jgi:hypothetical protein